MKPATFALDTRLDVDTVPIIDLELCSILLMRDARYPWVLAVPRVPGIVELTDLSRAQRAQLIEETTDVAGSLKAATRCEKVNVATLGNIVRQFHMHIVARDADDDAWPGPVWGRHPATAYAPGVAEALVGRMQAALG